MYLGKGLLAVVLEVPGVDVEVVVVDGEGLGAFGNARHKLFHLKQHFPLMRVKLLHRDVGRGYAVCREREKRGSVVGGSK